MIYPVAQSSLVIRSRHVSLSVYFPAKEVSLEGEFQFFNIDGHDESEIHDDVFTSVCQPRQMHQGNTSEVPGKDVLTINLFPLT